MTVFIQDTSTQTTSGISSNTYFSTQTIPKINFNGTGGIYNPSIDNIRIFTNNTDAFIGGQKRVNFAICLHRFTQFAHRKLCVNFFCCFSNLV